MNDILKAIDTRLKVLLAEAGRLYKAKELLGEATSPVTSITVPKQDSAMDKPMKSTGRRTIRLPIKHKRHTKKHRTAAGLLKGRILTLLRMQRGTVKELVKQLEYGGAARFPFAAGTNHTGCVRACLVTAKGKGLLASTNVAGRGEVYSIAHTVPYVDRTKTAVSDPYAQTAVKLTAPVKQLRASQYGLTDRIIKVLADEGVTGAGLTANGIIRKMEGNGFRFTAKAPQKSVTGLLSGMLKKSMVSRVIPYNQNTYHYKIRTTTELLEAVREDATND